MPTGTTRNTNAHRRTRASHDPPNAGLLVLRLVVGVTFLLHGVDKLGDLSGTEELFASLEIPAAGLVAPFVAVVETAGGLLLIAGLATPLAGVALAGDMFVALVTDHITTASSPPTAASSSSCSSAARAPYSPSPGLGTSAPTTS
jgi:putative oxidoreductase